jgi:hypothetical protein
MAAEVVTNTKNLRQDCQRDKKARLRAGFDTTKGGKDSKDKHLGESVRNAFLCAGFLHRSHPNVI